MQEKALQNARQEMRRGVLTLSVLSQLQNEHYGYSLLQELKDQGLPIDQNTLYPLLRRLEQQGFLESRWRVEGSRPRRYYRLNEAGMKALSDLRQQWQEIDSALQRLLTDPREGKS